MTTFLIVALAVMTLLCIVLGRYYWALAQSVEARRKGEKELHDEWLAERMHWRGCVSRVASVLDTNVGGIGKRVSESVEIAEALQKHAPEVFKANRGLAYWLHANDQFLHALYDATAEHVDPVQRRRVHEVRKNARPNELFIRIYEEAGLPPIVLPELEWRRQQATSANL
ncbi:hypothetical protein [Paraburkholderia youngii]|uniref:hypothetical protein n=1 Tax=Paraburkholderia youngii TaxID=2782701 RepID=UPI003D1BB167